MKLSRNILVATLSLLPLLSLGLCWPGSEARAETPKHVSIMLSWVGQRETNGPNRSPFIDSICRHAHIPLGSHYCAAGVWLALDLAHVSYPKVRTATAQGYRSKRSVGASAVLNGRGAVKPGMIAIWSYGRSWRGHAGLVVRVIDRQTVETVECNTSCRGGGTERDGDGICRKVRKIEPYNSFALRWFEPVEYG